MDRVMHGSQYDYLDSIKTEDVKCPVGRSRIRQRLNEGR
jgi:hypothetical protein